jgi:translation initiation factor IF-3
MAVHTRHLTTPAQALYRVFVLPALSPSSTTALKTPRPSPRSSNPPPIRPFSTTPNVFAKTRAPTVRTELWDEEIRAPFLYLINPETNTINDPHTGRPPEPSERRAVLRSFDRETHRLIKVADGFRQHPTPDPVGGKEEVEGGWVDIPICKIINKKAAYEANHRAKQIAKEKRNATAKTNSVKTLELNWAIDPNDLGHRLGLVRGFLEEGRKVEIVLAAKKRGRKATPDECQGVLGRIRGVVGEVEGAKEVADMKGNVGGFTVLMFQGRVLKTT